MSETDHTPAIAAIERIPPDRLHPLVRQAMELQPDPATLRELLALQREWQAGEARRQYTEALVQLKRDLPHTLARDKLVAFEGRSGRTAYRHTSLAAVLDAISEPLQAHGFSHSWHPATEGETVSVTCRLTHAAGHREEVTMSAPADTSGHKSPAQARASTTTLLQRYTLMSLLGIASGDQVEDGDDAVDAARNLRAVAAITRAGIPLAEAEDAAGAPVTEWTATHLDLLRDLVRSREAAKGGRGERP